MWSEPSIGIVVEGLTVAPYSTAYCHPDKCASVLSSTLPPSSLPLRSDGGELGVLYATQRSHFITTLSTTMTFATTLEVLWADARHIAALSEPGRPPMDFALWPMLKAAAGRTLVCSVPGAATHAETAWLALYRDWKAIVSAASVD